VKIWDKLSEIRKKLVRLNFFHIFTVQSDQQDKTITNNQNKKETNKTNKSQIKNRAKMAKKTIITEVQDVEVGESILEFPQNRTLMVEKLTQDDPTKPDIAKGLKTMDDVFDHFKPKTEVEFQDMEGVPKKETLNFNTVGDFGMKGITAQSSFLQGLQIQQDEYRKIIKQLKSNKQLRNAISDGETKQALLNSIHALLKELEDAK